MSDHLEPRDDSRQAPRRGITARSWFRSGVLIAAITITGGGLAAWKSSAIHASEAAAAN